MEKYNKVYFLLWLLFSVVVLVLSMLVLNNVEVMIELDENLENEGLVLSFILMILISEVIGAVLARSTIDRIPRVYDMYPSL